MKVRRRGERGQLELGAGLIILAGILAIPIAIAGAKDFDDWRRGKWEKQEPVAAAPTVTIPVFNDPPLPAKTDPRYDCYISRAASLRWVNGGWTHPDFPPPQITGRYATDRRAVDEWAKTLGEFVAAANFKQCDLEQEKPKPPKEELEDPNVSGTYQATLAYQGGPASSCNTAGYAQTFTVSQQGKGTISISTGGNRVFRGSLSPDLGFEATYENENGPTDRIRGAFHGQTGNRTIDSGVLTFGSPDVDTPCTYTFDATQVGAK